jgi:hypothetical protein
VGVGTGQRGSELESPDTKAIRSLPEPWPDLLDDCCDPEIGARPANFSTVLERLPKWGPQPPSQADGVPRPESAAAFADLLAALGLEGTVPAGGGAGEGGLEELQAVNLLRLQESGRLRAWVEARPQGWDHAAWLGLLEDLGRAGFTPLNHDQLGGLLEAIRQDRLAPGRPVEVKKVEPVLPVEVPFPGLWSVRSAGQPEGDWEAVTRTPRTVSVAPGHVYRLGAWWGTPGEQLAGLGRLHELHALKHLDLEMTDVTDDVLPLLLEFKGLETLNLKWCGLVTDTGVASLRGLARLRHLDLRCCYRITETGLRHLGDVATLQGLHLGSVDGWPDRYRRLFSSSDSPVTDNGLAHLTRLSDLRNLGLANCGRIMDAGLANIGRMSGLRYLDLASCKGIRDAGLSHLRNLRNLEYLDLGDSPVGDAGLVYLGELTSLRRLNLELSQVGDAGLAHLHRLAGLHRLELGGSKITDVGLGHLRKLAGLQDLRLCVPSPPGGQHLYPGDMKVTDVGLAKLRELANLQYLDLGRLPISDAGLAQLASMSGLRHLCLRWCDGITDGGLASLRALTGLRGLEVGVDCTCSKQGALELNGNLTDAGLAHLAQIGTLRYLDYFGRVTDAGLAQLQTLKGLQHLRFHPIPTFTRLAHLRGLANLRYLALATTDAGLADLQGLTGLHRLDLAGSKFTDAGLAHLRGLTELRRLDLSYTNVTDAGLAHLQGLTQLRHLELGYCPGITDACLDTLRGLPLLCYVSMYQSGMSPEGMATLNGIIPTRNTYYWYSYKRSMPSYAT